MTEIPKIKHIDHDIMGQPGWVSVVDSEGHPHKPIVRCNCGQYVGMGLHHVHPDGTVTASFYHSQGTNYIIGEDPKGCGWHVWLKLLDYDKGEFLPETT